MIVVGRCQLDIERRQLHGPAGAVEVSPLASRLLRQLAEKSGALVSREDLITALWAGNFAVGDPALNRLVSETRKAAQKVGTPALIETVSRSGYRLLLPSEAVVLTADAAPMALVAPPRSAPIHWRRWLLRLLVLAVVIALLEWLISTLIGWQWANRHRD